ncbi:Uncharacterized protein TCM_035704 [Theobroma cacao]|uniref:Uncharacterized protein n=1 Tax=Theobroma cacao TaxID=3641 RepID=A0A061FIC2_THECC|nr:Uncharacterized protein TCM_035704 [Theobroma cacao]
MSRGIIDAFFTRKRASIIFPGRKQGSTSCMGFPNAGILIVRGLLVGELHSHFLSNPMKERAALLHVSLEWFLDPILHCLLLPMVPTPPHDTIKNVHLDYQFSTCLFS